MQGKICIACKPYNAGIFQQSKKQVLPAGGFNLTYSTDNYLLNDNKQLFFYGFN